MRPNALLARPAVMLALALVSCTGGEADPNASPTPATRQTSSLIGRNLDLLPGAPGALRIGFEPLGGTARVIVTYTPIDAVVDLCPLREPEAEALPRDGCVRDVRTGVREPVTNSHRGIAIVLRSEQPAEADIVVEYEEGTRALTIELPIVPPPPGGIDCSDNACNPFFLLQPTREGPFEARGSWEGPDGLLVLLQGSVLARAQTATGIRYGEPARRTGAPPLSITTTMSAPAEYALALRHTRVGSAVPPMRNVVLEVSWPG